MKYFRPRVYLSDIPQFRNSVSFHPELLLWIIRCEKKEHSKNPYYSGLELKPLEIITLDDIHDIDLKNIKQDRLEAKVKKYCKQLKRLISKVSKYNFTEYENYILVVDEYNDAVGSAIALVIESIFALAYSYDGVLMSADTLPNVRLLKTFDAILGTNALEHGMSQRYHVFYSVARELCVYPELTVESINNFDTIKEVYKNLSKYRIKRSFNTILLELLSFARDQIRSFDSWNEMKFFAVYNPLDFNPNWYRTNSVGMERYAKWFDSEVLDYHEWIHFDLCGVENNTLYIRNTLSRGYFSVNDRPPGFESAIEFIENYYKQRNNPIGKKGEELEKLEEYYNSFGTLLHPFDLLYGGIPGPPGNRWKPVYEKPVYEELPLLESVDDEDENEGNI